MRARMVVAFFFGFAAGAVCLALALWLAGPLREWPILHAQSQPLPATPGASTLPDARAASRYPGAPETPAGVPGPEHNVPAPAPPAEGGASREMTQLPASGLKLLFPVQGVDPHSIGDTYDETRGNLRHEAQDIMAPRGTPVLAAAEGNVAKLFTSKQGGLTVYQFDDSQTYCFYYAHLDRYAPSLKEGILLRRGDPVGYVGSTGDASAEAPHLHFAIFRLGAEKRWWQGTPIDPFPYLTGGRPLP